MKMYLIYQIRLDKGVVKTKSERTLDSSGERKEK